MLTFGSTGEEGEEGEHKADRKAEDGQDHEQSLQAHVTEVHAGDVQPSQDDVQIDPQLEQQGEPPQIDADGHVEGEAHGEAEVEAPSEGEGQGDIKTEYVHVHGAEAHHVDGEEARRHAEIEAEVAGQEATDMTDMTEVHDVGQHDVDQQGEHPSASHVDLSHHDEGAEHKVRCSCVRVVLLELGLVWLRVRSRSARQAVWNRSSTSSYGDFFSLCVCMRLRAGGSC